MTKNVTGGNKSKKIARKHSHNTSDNNNTLLLSTHTLEKYAIVTKMLGNGMFYATTYDGFTNIIGHIRNKFKGRSKHSNLIQNGSFILLGFREWEQPNFKNADLIHIYSSNDFQTLQNFVNLSSIINDNQLQHDILFDNEHDHDHEHQHDFTNNNHIDTYNHFNNDFNNNINNNINVDVDDI
jgi:initiation factor 1A